MRDDELIAFRVGLFDMQLVPAGPSRDWIAESTQGFAHRCLPMRIANQAGWFLLNDRPLRAIWRGGRTRHSLIVRQEGSPPFSAVSHFGHGILTFTLPFLFRTGRGVSLLFRGPANAPKDAIAALEGVVETDWAVATAAVSWKFTRADTWIEFARGEPICMIVPQRLSWLEKTDPSLHALEEDPALRTRYHTWRLSRDAFNEGLRSMDPQIVRQGWQRHYHLGTFPTEVARPEGLAPGHRTHLKLQPFRAEPRGSLQPQSTQQSRRT